MLFDFIPKPKHISKETVLSDFTEIGNPTSSQGATLSLSNGTLVKYQAMPSGKCLIELVYVPENCRGKGYATKIVEELLSRYSKIMLQDSIDDSFWDYMKTKYPNQIL